MEWYDDLNPIDRQGGECGCCGTPIDTDKDFCSSTCYEQDTNYQTNKLNLLSVYKTQ